MAIKIDQRSKDSTYIETGSLTIYIEHSPNCAEDYISVWNKNVEDKIIIPIMIFKTIIDILN